MYLRPLVVVDYHIRVPFDPYNFLWRRHNARTRRLASANSEWAEIQARRGKDGLLFLSEEANLDFSHWKRQQEIEDEICPYPMYLKVLEHLSPSRHQTFHPRWWRRNFMRRWERSKKGWAYSDVWNLGSYLCLVAEGSIRHLRDSAHSWPGEPMTFEEWLEILDKMANGFGAASKMHDADTPEEEERLKVQFDEGFDLFKKYLPLLWD